MRLGLWNRLAVVATVLALIILPAWFILSANVDFAERHEQGYQECLRSAMRSTDGTLTGSACREIWPAVVPYSYGWAQWGEMVIATFVMCVALYGLIWLTVWTIKWVWRGRDADSPSKKS